jgi:hypothetical protein
MMERWNDGMMGLTPVPSPKKGEESHFHMALGDSVNLPFHFF